MSISLAVTALGSENPKVVAYVPNWIDLTSFSKTLPYEKVTHLNIAFENPTNSEGDLSFHSADAILISRGKEEGVKILVSIGGGSASENNAMRSRYEKLLSNELRPGFVSRLAAYVVKHGFDGLDVDLEGPAIGKNYGAFIAELATALKPQGKLLTAALSKGYGGDKVPDSVFADLDFINIMAYDATGPWSPKKPGQHSSLEFAQDNVQWWLGRGLPKVKAVLGVPFYGHGFGEAFSQKDYSYRALVETYPGAEKVDQVGETIWYNGLPTIIAKSRYALEQELGGIMVWSLDQDAQGENSLLKAINKTLHSPAGEP